MSNQPNSPLEGWDDTLKAINSGYQSALEEINKEREEKKQLSQENKNLQEILTVVAKSSDSGFLRTDESGKVIDAFFGASLGVEKRKCIGAPLQTALDLNFTLNEYEGVYESRGNPYFIDEYRLNEGGLTTIQPAASELALRECLTTTDRIKSMGDMAGTLAHQIRTPLSSALLYFSFLLENPVSCQSPVFIRKGIENLEHLQGLVEDVLRYAKGGIHTNTFINPKNVLKIALQAVKKASTERLIEMRAVDKVLNDDYLIGDENGISTAIQNLIINAIEASEKGSAIDIVLEKSQKNEIVFCVKDYGKGIQKKEIGKIFEPFKTTKPNGNGLGLPMVKVIAEAHNGRIIVKSELDKGTTFSLHLPNTHKRKN